MLARTQVLVNNENYQPHLFGMCWAYVGLYGYQACFAFS